MGHRTGLAHHCLHHAGPGAFVFTSHSGIHIGCDEAGAKTVVAASALRCQGVRIVPEAACFELTVLGSSAGKVSEAGASALHCTAHSWTAQHCQGVHIMPEAVHFELTVLGS
jgi:hypothetical protein